MPPDTSYVSENLPQIVEKATVAIVSLSARIDALELAQKNGGPIATSVFPDAEDGSHTGAQIYDWMNRVLHKYFGGDMPTVTPDALRPVVNPATSNPVTGRAFNPVTGREINPVTGRDIDPATGLDI